jgi:hypothetical protein
LPISSGALWTPPDACGGRGKTGADPLYGETVQKYVLFAADRGDPISPDDALDLLKRGLRDAAFLTEGLLSDNFRPDEAIRRSKNEENEANGE